MPDPWGDIVHNPLVRIGGEAAGITPFVTLLALSLDWRSKLMDHRAPLPSAWGSEVTGETAVTSAERRTGASRPGFIRDVVLARCWIVAATFPVPCPRAS